MQQYLHSVIDLCHDDEKYLFTRNKNEGRQKPGCAVEDFLGHAHENIVDIIALGFDPKKTFIYTDYEYTGGHFYWNASEFESLVTFNQAAGAFGFGNSTNIGLVAYGAKQCVAAFPSSYPELFSLSSESSFSVAAFCSSSSDRDVFVLSCSEIAFSSSAVFTWIASS